MGRLNHGRIKALDSPGLHGDGDTLYLRVAPGGSKSWIQRVAVNGWRRDIGLGGWPVVPLARARQRAFTNRVAISEGRDPLAEHRVPLSDAALAVLERVLPLRDSSDLVFPSVRGRELSNMTLKKCLRTAGHRRRTARFPHVIQDLDQRADQRASRRRRDGAGARGRICRRAELCPGRAVSIRERSGRSIGTFPTSCRSRLTGNGRRLCSCRRRPRPRARSTRGARSMRSCGRCSRRPAASTALVIVPRSGRSTSRQLG